MNWDEALTIINKSKPASNAPEKESGYYLISEVVNIFLYSDLLNMYRNIERSQKIVSSLGIEKMPEKPKMPTLKETREEIKTAKDKTMEKKREIEQISKEKSKEEEKEEKQVKQDIKQDIKIEEGIEKEEIKVKELPEEKQENVVIEQTDRLKNAMIFKKDIMGSESYKGLHVAIPTKEQADEEAKRRASSLISKDQELLNMSKSELSSRLVKLTTELLKEKQEQKRVLIKAEIEKIKAAIEGRQKQMPVEDQIEKIIKDDINKAIETIKAAANAQKGKLSDGELYNAVNETVNAYKEYLIFLHTKTVEYLKIPFKQVDYSAFDALVNEYKVKEMAKEEIKTGIEKKEMKEEVKEISENEQEIKPEIEEASKKQQEEQKEQILSKEEEVIKAINSMKEAQLLHELGARDRKTFYSYLRGEITKQEALKKAKIIFAIEMGLTKEQAESLINNNKEG
jgi:hypothetical protein